MIDEYDYPIKPSEKEKKYYYLSTFFIVLGAVFFIPSIFCYAIGLEAQSGILVAISIPFLFCFIRFSIPYCDMRDSRHKRNVEMQNDFKGEWLPSGDGTYSYIVDGKLMGIM